MTKSIRILVVDDEEEVRNLLKEILEDAGCEAVTASQAYDGLKLFDEGGFDVVFTDVGMPGMSGRELARAIAKRTARCRWRLLRVGETLSARAQEKTRKSTG